MLSLRNRALTALALSLALTLPAFAAPAGEIDVKYLPDAADGVVSINVRQFLDSELIKKAGLDKLLADDQSQGILKGLGLDPLKDIARVIISNDKTNNDPYLIVQGTFDPAKLGTAAEQAAKDKKDILKIHKSDYGTVYEITKLDELVKVPPQAAGAGVNLKDKSVFAVIADKGNIVLVGSKESAEVVLAKAAGKKTTKLTNKELTGLIAKIDPKQTIALALPAPEEKLKSITGGITLTQDLKVDVTVTATDADAAKQLNDTIGEKLTDAQGIVGIIASQYKDLATAVTDVINSVKHDAKDNAVSIKSDIKGETLEKIAKAAAELAKKGGIK
jgi:hypothetical protein